MLLGVIRLLALGDFSTLLLNLMWMVYDMYVSAIRWMNHMKKAMRFMRMVMEGMMMSMFVVGIRLRI